MLQCFVHMLHKIYLKSICSKFTKRSINTPNKSGIFKLIARNLFMQNSGKTNKQTNKKGKVVKLPISFIFLLTPLGAPLLRACVGYNV